MLVFFSLAQLDAVIDGPYLRDEVTKNSNQLSQAVDKTVNQVLIVKFCPLFSYTDFFSFSSLILGIDDQV